MQAAYVHESALESSADHLRFADSCFAREAGSSNLLLIDQSCGGFGRCKSARNAGAFRNKLGRQLILTNSCGSGYFNSHKQLGYYLDKNESVEEDRLIPSHEYGCKKLCPPNSLAVLIGRRRSGRDLQCQEFWRQGGQDGERRSGQPVAAQTDCQDVRVIP